MSTPGGLPATTTDAARDAEEGGTTAAGVAAQDQHPRSSIPSILFLTFILFMMTNNGAEDIMARSQYQEALTSLEWQLGNYTAWLTGNATEGLNFSMPTKPIAEEQLVHSFVPLGSVLNPLTSSYFPNITGFIRGKSRLHNLTGTEPADYTWGPYAHQLTREANMTDVLERLGSWNWTASEKISMSVAERPLEALEDKRQGNKSDEHDGEEIAIVHGRIELTDTNTADELRFDFEGIHFLKNGSVYGFADPGGVIDIRLIPSLVPESERNHTAHLIIPELESRISKLRDTLNSGSFDSDSISLSDDAPRTNCRFSVYAQLAPTGIPWEAMHDLEEELQHPSGIATAPRPKLALDGALLSKDCGILLEVGDTDGLRSRTFFRKITMYAGFAAAMYLGMLVLLSRQMNRSRTVAQLSRISRWSFLSQALADSIAFAGHITFAILADGRPSLSLVAPAFLACTLFAYEVQFALLIQQVQAPEAATSPGPAPPPTPAPRPAPPPPSRPTPALVPAPASNAAAEPAPHARDEASLPLLSDTDAAPPPAPTPPAPPPPAPTPTQPPRPRALLARAPLLRALIHYLRHDAQARTWLLLFCILTAVVRLVVAPSLALAFFGALYGSFWAPQIARAARRGRACALGWEYVLGTTLGRLAIAMYFLTCPRNVLEIEPRGWMLPLTVLIALQLAVLVLQARLGPAFFLAPSAADAAPYDYHPPLPAPDPEAPESSPGDCSICMDAIRYDARADSTETKGTGKRRGAGAQRKSYSLAPCHHLFHTECLERWLAIKKICPQCRRPLPPL